LAVFVGRRRNSKNRSRGFGKILGKFEKMKIEIVFCVDSVIKNFEKVDFENLKYEKIIDLCPYYLSDLQNQDYCLKVNISKNTKNDVNKRKF
jgi:hypothetical protein